MVLLVALRLCIGWHFYKEGVKHYHDPHFTSAPMLQSAVGPWADHFHSLAGGDFHDWDALLAQPLALDPDAEPPAKVEEGEIPPDAPYAAWAEKITHDWRAQLHVYLDNFNGDKAKQSEAAEVYEKRKQQLLDYLDENHADIAEYRHELYRLDNLKNDATAEEVPFQRERIASKQRELAAQAAGWKQEIASFETNYEVELASVFELDDQQQSQARKLLKSDQLACLDQCVTYMTLGVGVCLLLGLFTRLASLVGAGFLLSVMATQPPWVSGAAPVYYQSVEMVALLVLAATAAGRWGGLDYFIYSLFRRCCTAEGSKS